MKVREKRFAPLGNGTHVHILIAETAKAMAHELYDICMSDNGEYKRYKEMCPELTPKLLEDQFVKLLWPKLVEQARATLAKMLAGPYNEVLKNDIHRALVLDASLRRGRTRAPGFRLH